MMIQVRDVMGFQDTRLKCYSVDHVMMMMILIAAMKDFLTTILIVVHISTTHHHLAHLVLTRIAAQHCYYGNEMRVLVETLVHYSVTNLMMIQATEVNCYSIPIIMIQLKPLKHCFEHYLMRI